MSHLGKESSRLSLCQSTKHRQACRMKSVLVGDEHRTRTTGDGAYQRVSECSHMTTKQARQVQSLHQVTTCAVITLKQRNLGVSTNPLFYRLERVWHMTEEGGKTSENKM